MRKLVFISSLFFSAFLFAQNDELDFSDDTLLLNSDTLSLNTDSLSELDAPQEEVQEVIYTPKLSHIRVPITINIPTLEKQVNDNLKGLLYEDSDMSDDGLLLKAWKARDFKFSMEGDTLLYKLPIKVWAKKSFDLGLTSVEREINAEIEVVLSTVISLRSDWKLNSSTKIVSYEWTKKPTITAMGIDLQIGFIADILIKKNKEFIVSTLDETISENLPLPTYMKELWDELQQPIPVDAEGYQAWILCRPEAIACTPIRASLGKIRSNINIDSKVEVYVGDKPKATATKSLPNLRISESLSDSFDIHILADLPYTLMDSVAGSFLVGQSFGEGKKSIVVDSLSFYAGGEHLIISLQVSGFVKGKIFLECTPYFDRQSQELRVKDVDYKIKSKNVLVKMVNLFYKRGLKRKIEEEMKISLKDEFFLLSDLSNSALFDSELMPGVKLNGRIHNLDVSDIFITKDGLKIALIIEGKIRLSME